MRTRTRLPALLIPLLPLAAGCSSTRIAHPGPGSEIRTIASVGDRPLATVAGEPGASVVGAEPDARPDPTAEGRIAGRVVDDLGDPVPGVAVRLAEAGAARGRVVRTRTDAAGGFTLRGVRPGVEHTVVAEYEDDQGVLSGRVLAEASDLDVQISLREADAAPIAARPRPSSARSGLSRVSGRAVEPDEGLDDPGAPGPDDLVPAVRPSPRASRAGEAGSAWRRGGSAALPAAGPDHEAGPEPESGPMPRDLEPFEVDDDIPNPLPPARERPESSGAGPDEFESAARPREDPSRGAGELVAAPPARPRRAPAAAAEPTPSPEPAPPAEADGLASAAADAEDDYDPFATADRPEPDDYDPFAIVDAAAPPYEPEASAPEPEPAPAIVRREPPPARPIARRRPTAPAPAPTPAEPTAPAPADPARPRPRWGDLSSAEFDPPAPTIQRASLAADIAPARPRPEPVPEPEPESTPEPAPEAAPEPTPEPAAGPASPDDSADKAERKPPAREHDDGKPFCDYDPRERRVADFRLPDLMGRMFRLREQVDADFVLLDFWGTWCAPCKDSIPHLVELQEKLGKDRIVVIGVACERGPAKGMEARVAATARKYGVNYPILVGAPDGSDPLQRALQISVYPTLVLLDRQGNVVWQNPGITPMALARLDRAIADASRADRARR